MRGLAQIRARNVLCYLGSDTLQNADRIVRQFAFPDCNDTPAGLHKFISFAHVALNSPAKFLTPEIRSGFGRGCIWTSFMSMPVAAVYKYRCLVFAKDDIRLAWQLRVVEPKPKS